jgi:transposase
MTETKRRKRSVIPDAMIKRHEMTDEQWDRIKDMVPPERSGGKDRPAKDNRMMINAIIWILKTGAPWRDLPERYGSWNSVYSRYSRRTKRGIWGKIFFELSKDQDNEEYMMDHTSVSTNMVRAEKGARKTRNWSFSRWIYHKGPCRSGRFGQSDQDLSDGRASQ